MATDVSIQALRGASPRHQPGFGERIDGYDTLRAQITASPFPSQLRSPPLLRGRLLGFSAAAAAVCVAAVLLGLVMSSASPQSAYATVKRALAATTAAASGTMTMTVTHDGNTYTLGTTRWSRGDIAVSSGQRHLLGPNTQLVLVGGAVYVQQADGRWLHYASASDAGPKLAPQVQLAHDNVTGNTAAQILDLATDVQQTKQSDGRTVYTGVIPDSSADPAITATDDAILRMIMTLRGWNEPGAPDGLHKDLRLQMTVASDGRLRHIGLTFQQERSDTAGGDGNYTWSVGYSQLGSTPPITAPVTSTPGKS